MSCEIKFAQGKWLSWFCVHVIWMTFQWHTEQLKRKARKKKNQMSAWNTIYSDVVQHYSTIIGSIVGVYELRIGLFLTFSLSHILTFCAFFNHHIFEYFSSLCVHYNSCPYYSPFFFLPSLSVFNVFFFCCCIFSVHCCVYGMRFDLLVGELKSFHSCLAYADNRTEWLSGSNCGEAIVLHCTR